VLQLVAADAQERQGWRDAVAAAITHARQTTRGYLLKRNAGAGAYSGTGPPPAQLPEEDALWSRHYFVLHSGGGVGGDGGGAGGWRITFHADHR
jgi:hypothetical protein